MNSEKIAQIARELKPCYEPVLAAGRAVESNEGQGDDQMEKLADACGEYNLMYLSYLPVLASVTPNSEDTLRLAFYPKDIYETYPAPEFLMNVANYNSFNDRLWTKNSGMFREPSNKFTF